MGQADRQYTFRPRVVGFVHWLYQPRRSFRYCFVLRWYWVWVVEVYGALSTPVYSFDVPSITADDILEIQPALRRCVKVSGLKRVADGLFRRLSRRRREMLHSLLRQDVDGEYQRIMEGMK